MSDESGSRLSTIDELLLANSKLDAALAQIRIERDQWRARAEKAEAEIDSIPVRMGRHDNEAQETLGKVYRHRLGADGGYPEIGVVEAQGAKIALASACAARDHAVKERDAAQADAAALRERLRRAEEMREEQYCECLEGHEVSFRSDVTISGKKALAIASELGLIKR